MKTANQLIFGATLMLVGVGALAQVDIETYTTEGPFFDSGFAVNHSAPMSGRFRGPMMQPDLFPPELVMHNQRMIDLTDEQQKAIRAEVQKVVAKVSDLRWDVTATRQEMERQIKAERIDEKRTLSLVDKLDNLENEIGRLELTLKIRIKNILTSEQQAKLRDSAMTMPMGPGRHFGAGEVTMGRVAMPAQGGAAFAPPVQIDSVPPTAPPPH
jgi:Spy/CpxP family protein refolding chaperone